MALSAKAGPKRILRGFSAACSALPLPPRSGTSSATISTSTSLNPSSASSPVPAASSLSSALKESRVCSHRRRREKRSCATRSTALPSTSRPTRIMAQPNRDLVLYPGAKASSPWQFRQQECFARQDRAVHHLFQPDHGQALPLDHGSKTSHRLGQNESIIFAQQY